MLSLSSFGVHWPRDRSEGSAAFEQPLSASPPASHDAHLRQGIPTSSRRHHPIRSIAPPHRSPPASASWARASSSPPTRDSSLTDRFSPTHLGDAAIGAPACGAGLRWPSGRNGHFIVIALTPPFSSSSAHRTAPLGDAHCPLHARARRLHAAEPGLFPGLTASRCRPTRFKVTARPPRDGGDAP